MSRSSKDTESSSSSCVRFEPPSTSRRQTDRTSFISPKQIIYEAVEALELEATKWRNASDHITTEVEALRRENDQLRQQLETTKEERDAANRQMKALDEVNRKLEAENRRCIDGLDKESRKANELEEMLRRRTAEESEELHRLKDALNRKAADLKAVQREQEKEEEAMKQVRLEKTTKENLDDRSFELLHEVDSLKRELQTLRASKDEMSRTNLNLLTEIKNVETLLSDRELQLRNETMRHSLLTTQFNSLMEENAALKEKHHVKAMPRYSDREGGGAAPSTPTTPVVISIQDTNRLQISSTLPVKTSVNGIIPDHSLPKTTSLCRNSSFSTGLSNRDGGTGGGGGGGYGDGNWKRDSIHRLSLSRGRSCVDKKRASVASSDAFIIQRRNQTNSDSLQVPTISDDSVSSTSSRTLPLLVNSSTTGKKWKP